MAKITDLRISACDGNERIDFTTPVSVTKEGVFSTRLPQQALDTLKEYGYDGFKTNRLGNEGYFSSDTLADLEKQLKSIANDVLSRDLIEDKLVIKYDVKGRYCYCMDKDNPREIYPNGYYVPEGRRAWKNDKDTNASVNGYIPYVSLYARVYHKKKYQYASGKTVEYFEYYQPVRPTSVSEQAGAVDWINNLVHIATERRGWQTTDEILKSLPEVDATPENAALFVNIFKFIFKAATLMDMIRQPEDFVRAVTEGQLKQLKF